MDWGRRALLRCLPGGRPQEQAATTLQSSWRRSRASELERSSRSQVSAAAVRRRAAARTSLVTDRAGELARLRALCAHEAQRNPGQPGPGSRVAGAGRERDGRVVTRRGERRGRVAARGGARRRVAAYRDAGGHVPAGPSANL